MRKPAVVLAIALALGGCKHAGSARLEGTWKGTRADGVAAGTEDAANAFAKGTEIVVKGNQITISTPASKGAPATYVVDSEDRSKVVVHTDKDGEKAKETFTFSPDGNTMVWKLDDARTITFAKRAEGS